MKIMFFSEIMLTANKCLLPVLLLGNNNIKTTGIENKLNIHSLNNKHANI
jgi:hypothetical protein